MANQQFDFDVSSYLAIIRPINVGKKIIRNGASTIADAKLMKRFGKVRVILRRKFVTQQFVTKEKQVNRNTGCYKPIIK